MSLVGSAGSPNIRPLVADAVGVGIKDERSPALRRLCVPVSSNCLVLSQPRTGTDVPLGLKYSVLSASCPNCRWCVPKHVSIIVNSFVSGS